MKGYHYTSLKNWRCIEEEGLSPSPIDSEWVLKNSSETVGSWLFQNQQDGPALFGQLIDIFARQDQLWEYVELEVDFSIKDCLKALHEEDTLSLTHDGSCGPWMYHENEPIIIISKTIPACQIKLLRTFDLERSITT